MTIDAGHYAIREIPLATARILATLRYAREASTVAQPR
jgi:hypothetical protein